MEPQIHPAHLSQAPCTAPGAGAHHKLTQTAGECLPTEADLTASAVCAPTVGRGPAPAAPAVPPAQQEPPLTFSGREATAGF